MSDALERRVRVLEGRSAPPATPPRLIVGEPGEAAEDALRRIYGDDIPEPKPGSRVPPFIVAVGVEPLPRSEA